MLKTKAGQSILARSAFTRFRTWVSGDGTSGAGGVGGDGVAIGAEVTAAGDVAEDGGDGVGLEITGGVGFDVVVEGGGVVTLPVDEGVVEEGLGFVVAVPDEGFNDDDGFFVAGGDDFGAVVAEPGGATATGGLLGAPDVPGAEVGGFTDDPLVEGAGVVWDDGPVSVVTTFGRSLELEAEPRPCT